MSGSTPKRSTRILFEIARIGRPRRQAASRSNAWRWLLALVGLLLFALRLITC